jgi:hypothetical protein
MKFVKVTNDRFIVSLDEDGQLLFQHGMPVVLSRIDTEKVRQMLNQQKADEEERKRPQIAPDMV